MRLVDAVSVWTKRFPELKNGELWRVCRLQFMSQNKISAWSETQLFYNSSETIGLISKLSIWSFVKQLLFNTRTYNFLFWSNSFIFSFLSSLIYSLRCANSSIKSGWILSFYLILVVSRSVLIGLDSAVVRAWFMSLMDC